MPDCFARLFFFFSSAGVWTEKSRYGKTYWGVERSHFVIDETGRVIEAAVKVKPEESVSQAVAALG